MNRLWLVGRTRESGTEEGPTTVPRDCSARDTTTRIPRWAVAATLDRHDETRHDGDRVAPVDAVVADGLADLVAAEL